MLTKADPQVRKATAIVNGAVITDLDIDQRLALAVAASGGRIGQQEREQLRIQVLRNLIDEKLQVAEAKEQEINVEEGQVEGAFARVAKNFGRSPDAFARYLKDIGTSAQSLRDQIRAEVAWSQLLRRRVEPFVNVGDDEVHAAMDRMVAAKGQQEYRLGEIFISASPSRWSAPAQPRRASSSRSAAALPSLPMPGSIRKPRRPPSAATWAGSWTISSAPSCAP
nr:SurA N-terminal domain-containing protein [Hankyongella ginsenosidimutans]